MFWVKQGPSSMPKLAPHLQHAGPGADENLPPKMNMSPGKGPFQKENTVVFQPSFFRVHVSFCGGIYLHMLEFPLPMLVDRSVLLWDIIYIIWNSNSPTNHWLTIQNKMETSYITAKISHRTTPPKCIMAL